jgi:hypothetical protein
MGRWSLLLMAVLSAVLTGGCGKSTMPAEPQPLSEEKERRLDQELRRRAEGGESREQRPASRPAGKSAP